MPDRRTTGTKATTKKAGKATVTPLVKVNGWCTDGLHLWCPAKAGRYGRQPCACGCHSGHTGGAS
jgi:hypothetical protein